MELKKYTICNTLEEAVTFINIITNNMIIDEESDLQPGESWATPMPITGKFEIGEEVKHITGKYFFPNPDKKYINFPLTEQTDINPNNEKIHYYKIYDYMNDDIKERFRDWTKAPHSLNYKTSLNIKLQPDIKFDKLGNVVEVIYYLNCEHTLTSINYSDPIIKYNAQYFYDITGYVTHRIVERRWMMTDDTWSDDAKTTTKHYTKVQSRSIGLRRRKNLVDNLVLEVGYFVMITEGIADPREAELIAKPFLDNIGLALNNYYESGNMKDPSTGTFPLYDKVLNSTESFLNNILPVEVTGIEGISIRMYILNRIDVNPDS